MSRTRTMSAPQARLTCLIAGLLLLLPAMLSAQSEIERVVEARPDGLVTISNVAGSVVVTGWDRAEVEVTGSLGRGVEELVVESRGRSVEIEVDLERRTHGRDGNADLEIRVPRGSELDVEVVSAEVEISEVSGEVTVESVSGSITIEGAPKELDVESVSGAIDIDVDGEAEVRQVVAESVSGEIRLRGAMREIEAESVSGEIDIEAGEIAQAELSTTSGYIEVRGALAAGAEIEIESHSGSVELSLPSETSARFDVATHSGRIHNQLGPPPDRNRYGPGKELEFSIGGGAARVKIDTFSGSVDLRRQD